MNNKIEDLLSAVKLGELIHKKEEEKKKSPVLCILAIIGAIASVAAIAYAVYRYFTPDYLEDFEDDFEDDYEDECDEDSHSCCCESSNTDAEADSSIQAPTSADEAE